MGQGTPQSFGDAFGLTRPADEVLERGVGTGRLGGRMLYVLEVLHMLEVLEVLDVF